MDFEREMGVNFGAGAKAKAKVIELQKKFKNVYKFRCFDKHGNLKWEDVIENLVVDEGLTLELQEFFKGAAYTALHYLGLTGTTPSFAVGDDMTTHAGWTEVTAYDEANRITLVWNAAAAKAIDNVGNEATFTISANSTTIGGAFICTENTKGGSAGVLYGGGAFSAGDKVLDDNDTLEVTVTCSATSS